MARKPTRRTDKPTGPVDPQLPLTSLLRQPRRVVLAQPSHAFRVGERLKLNGGGRQLTQTSGGCEVVARLPYEGRGALQYRVRSDTETFDRIVSEVDLSRSLSA